MYRFLLVTACFPIVFNNPAFGAENSVTAVGQKHVASEIRIADNGSTSSVTKNNVASHHDITYIEKVENPLRTPNINKYYEEHKKKKKPKKTPKRTIQKIIKKTKSKLRRVYFERRAKLTTLQPREDYERLYAQEENQNTKSTTTQANQRKKSKRKYSPKFSGYHMPFQKMQRKDKKEKKDNKRHKRGLSRELYILKDLDEIEFLSNEGGDQDVVKAHVKNFW